MARAPQPSGPTPGPSRDVEGSLWPQGFVCHSCSATNPQPPASRQRAGQEQLVLPAQPLQQPRSHVLGRAELQLGQLTTSARELMHRPCNTPK